MRGCKPNSNVATMRITFNCEFIPVGDYIPICPLDFAISGPRTSDAVQAMVTMCPQVATLTAEKAREVADAVISSGSTNFNTLMSGLRQCFYGTSYMKQPMILNMDTGTMDTIVDHEEVKSEFDLD